MNQQFIKLILKYLTRCPTNGIQEAQELVALAAELGKLLDRLNNPEPPAEVTTDDEFGEVPEPKEAAG